MNDRIPYFLHQATVSLYPTGADGQPITASPIWSGALATGLRSSMDLEEYAVMGAGELYATARHLNEEHVIEIERTWLIRRQIPQDFVPVRNQQYVLELVWYDPTELAWYQRRYYGVTGRRVQWQSAGTNQFGTSQVFRAQRFTDNGGTKTAQGFTIYDPTQEPPVILGPGPYTPLPQVPNETQVVPFMRENPMIVGDYLLGVYRWPTAVKLGFAEAFAWASQGQDTILALEVNGSLVELPGITADETDITADGGTITADTDGSTPAQIDLPQGTANTEVSGNVDLQGIIVPAGQMVRWKILSGPIPEQAAWACALTMEVTPL